VFSRHESRLLFESDLNDEVERSDLLITKQVIRGSRRLPQYNNTRKANASGLWVLIVDLKIFEIPTVFRFSLYCIQENLREFVRNIRQ